MDSDLLVLKTRHGRRISITLLTMDSPMTPPILTEPRTMAETIQREITLNMKQGLHIRACSALVSIASGFSGQVTLKYHGRTADASSMFDLLALGVEPHDSVSVEATGEGATGVVEQIEELFALASLG